MRFELGRCSGEVRLSWLSNSPCRFSVACETGTIEGDVYDFQTLRLKTNSSEARPVAIKSAIKSKADVGYRVVGNFIEVITKGARPLIAGSDVLDSLEFIDECYRSATRLDMPWYEKALEVQSVS